MASVYSSSTPTSNGVSFEKLGDSDLVSTGFAVWVKFDGESGGCVKVVAGDDDFGDDDDVGDDDVGDTICTNDTLKDSSANEICKDNEWIECGSGSFIN